MLNRRRLLGALAFTAAVTFGALASAMSPQTFDQKAFDAAQAAGNSILLEVSAPWCPTCKAQAPILSKLTNEAKYKNFVRFNIDFDSQKPLLRTLKVTTQSTLIVYKGKTEAGRSTGDTNPASIEALLAKAI